MEVTSWRTFPPMFLESVVCVTNIGNRTPRKDWRHQLKLLPTYSCADWPSDLPHFSSLDCQVTTASGFSLTAFDKML